MTLAVCPGSFDPVTNGHVDIVERASRLFERVRVGVLVNPAKAGRFEPEQRIAFLRDALGHLVNVDVDSFTGLLVDYCVRHGASTVVKGVRSAVDIDYETPMAQMNRTLSGLETVFVVADPRWSFVSSSLVTEVARFGGDVSNLVPSGVAAALAGS
jgi:pantetheine-phosphate adenylyltransferase